MEGFRCGDMGGLEIGEPEGGEDPEPVGGDMKRCPEPICCVMGCVGARIAIHG